MDDIWIGFGILIVVGFMLDMIPDKRGSWKSGAASASDVARIVAGGKPAPTPRSLAKFVLLLVAVAAMAFVFLGGGQ